MSPDEPFMDQDPIDPQSWDLYSYVRNNPSSSTDPNGLWCVWEDGTHDDTEHNGGASQGDCQGQGGHWDQYNTITGITQTDGVVTSISTVFGKCTSGNCGVGMTLEGFDQTLQSYTRGDVPTLDVPLSPEAQAIFTLAYYRSMHDLGCTGLGFIVGGSGSAGVAAGRPTIDKPFAGEGAMKQTSAASEAFRDATKGARGGARLPTPVGGPGTGQPFKFRPTNSVGGVWGRWAPYVGGALTAYGAYETYNCLSTTPTR